MRQGVATKRSTCDNAQKSQNLVFSKIAKSLAPTLVAAPLRQPMPYDFPPFRPHPLVRGGHLQTLVGTYLPNRLVIDSNPHRVSLPDGDAIALHDDGPLENPIAGSKPAPGVP